MSLADELSNITQIQAECRKDLADIPSYLRRNDPGVQYLESNKELDSIEIGLERAYLLSEKVSTDTECSMVITNYLRMYRAGHLDIIDAYPASSVRNQNLRFPEIIALSSKTLLLRIPTFDSYFSGPIRDLLQKNRNLIRRSPNLIIDVRGNDGGSDWSWEYLNTLIRANPVRQYSMEFLATPENVESIQATRDIKKSDIAITQFLDSESSLMQSSPVGKYFRKSNKSEEGGRFIDVLEFETTAMPRRVAILVDSHCASSCEEFVLQAKQSWKTKIFGSYTAGVLDYSNLRLHWLPSRKRLLAYAISRSSRLPDFPIDKIGVQPDFFMPTTESKVGDVADKAVFSILKVLETQPNNIAR